MTHARTAGWRDGREQPPLPYIKRNKRNKITYLFKIPQNSLKISIKKKIMWASTANVYS